jgi:hypothetical protein
LPLHIDAVVAFFRPSAEKREFAECEVSLTAIGTQIGHHANALNSINDEAHPAAIAVEPILLAHGDLQDTMGHPPSTAQVARSSSEVEELSFRIRAVLGACA